jgi:hypothetical protein
MADIPYPRSFPAAQAQLLRELDDECRALEKARRMNLAHMRVAVEAFAREVKANGGSIERMLALLRACMRETGISNTGAASRANLDEQAFQWALEVYYGPR